LQFISKLTALLDEGFENQTSIIIVDV